MFDADEVFNIVLTESVVVYTVVYIYFFLLVVSNKFVDIVILQRYIMYGYHW